MGADGVESNDETTPPGTLFEKLSEAAPEVVTALKEIATDDNAPLGDRLRAAEILLDHAYWQDVK